MDIDYISGLRHAQYYKDLLSRANQRVQFGGDSTITGLQFYDLEKENILRGHSWSVNNFFAGVETKQLCCSYPNAGAMILPLRLTPHERIVWFEKGVEGARFIGNREMEGFHFGNMGLALNSLGENSRAVKCFEKALSISEESGDLERIAAQWGNLGIAYSEMGNFQHALEFHGKCLQIFRDIKNQLNEAKALGNLGDTFNKSGKFDKAMEYFKQALVLFRASGDRLGEANTLGDLGLVYSNQGLIRKAIL
jgi:tetratricopeptide (TPR) repeat protein